jgi:hypothetical protein
VEPIARGELVLGGIETLDALDNNGTKTRMKRVKPKDTVGAFVNRKMFKYKIEVNGLNVKYTIWRIQ